MLCRCLVSARHVDGKTTTGHFLPHCDCSGPEEFNQFTKWLFFGGEGVIAQNVRHEQRKVIKYNQLVANLFILHNVEAMTRVLKEIQAEEFVVDAAVLGGLAPYRVEHIN